MRAPLLLALLAAPGAAAAPLTLRSAAALALRRSPEVAAARARAAEAGLEEPLLLANTDPTIEAAYNFTDDRAPRALPAFEGTRARVERWEAGLAGRTLLGTQTKLAWRNERVANPTPFRPIDPTAISRLSLDVRQGLGRYFWGRPDVARRARARRGTAAAEGRLRDAEARAAAGAARAYLELAFAARQRAVKEGSVEDAERLLAKYEEKRRYGLAEESDLMQARASLEVQRADLLLAQSHLERARHALAAALAADELPAEPAAIDGAPAEAALPDGEALARRPDVLAARAQAEAAEWAARVARLDTLPDVSLVGNYQFAGLADSYGDARRDMTTWRHPVYSAGAELALPLAFRKERLTRRQALLARDAAKAEAARVENAARRELRDAREELSLARRRLEAGRRLLEAERRKFAAEEANFKRGRSSTDLLLRFQQDIRRAEIEVARAETDQAAALVELARAQGRLLEELTR